MLLKNNNYYNRNTFFNKDLLCPLSCVAQSGSFKYVIKRIFNHTIGVDRYEIWINYFNQYCGKKLKMVWPRSEGYCISTMHYQKLEEKLMAKIQMELIRWILGWYSEKNVGAVSPVLYFGSGNRTSFIWCCAKLDCCCSVVGAGQCWQGISMIHLSAWIVQAWGHLEEKAVWQTSRRTGKTRLGSAACGPRRLEPSRRVVVGVLWCFTWMRSCKNVFQSQDVMLFSPCAKRKNI